MQPRPLICATSPAIASSPSHSSLWPTASAKQSIPIEGPQAKEGQTHAISAHICIGEVTGTVHGTQPVAAPNANGNKKQQITVRVIIRVDLNRFGHVLQHSRGALSRSNKTGCPTRC